MLTFNNPSNVDDAGNALFELNGATGVTTAVVNGTTYVFVAGNVDDGISVFSVAANGTLTNVFNIDDASNAALELDGAVRLTIAVIGGATYLFSTGNVDDGVSVFSVANNGALTNVSNVDDASSAALLDSATGIATGLSGTNRYIIVTSIANDAVNVFSVAANGALAFVSSVVDDATLELDGAAAVTTAIVGGITYVFVAGSVDDGVSTFRLNVDGSLTNIAGGNVTDAGALELDGAQTLTTAVVGGTTYLFVGGSPDQGISVFSVAANGNLTNVFNVTDDATLKLLGVIDLTTAVVNGTTYLYAAGSGDAGVSVFSVANNGALTDAGTIADAGSLELQGVAGVTTATINANTYVIAAGSTDDGVSVLNQAPVIGQFWYVAEGGFDNSVPHADDYSDARVAYINDDSSDATTFVDNSVTTKVASGFIEEVVLDTAAGLYYILTGSDGLDARLLMGHIGSTAAPTVLLTFDPVFDSNNPDNIVHGLHLDPINHTIYLGYVEFIPNFDDAHQGIRQWSYNPSTGAISGGGYIVTQTTAQIQPATAGATAIFAARDFDIDYTHNALYATVRAQGDGFETNTLVRLNLADPDGSPAVALINQASFALNGDGGDFQVAPNGFITDVEVDQASDRVFFVTHQEAPDGSGALGLHDEDDAIWVITNASTATPGVATQVTLSGIPGAATLFYPEDIVLDEVNNILYVETEQADTSGASDDIILVFQLTSNTTASYIKTITPAAFTGVANIQGMFFDELATIANVNGTATHAVEQVTVLDLLTSAPTIADFESDRLNNATVTISNSFVGSGDDLYALDGATHRTSGLFTGTNITISRTTDGNGNQTLTLTGYDTFANYQTVMNAVAFTANGDNPTNYGYNTTRTISWQVNDGAADNPSGTPNGTTTNLRTTTVTIDAVNDAPQNNLPGTPSVNEDVQTAITGISITDVDADPANQDITVTFSVAHGTLNLLTNVLNGIQASDITGGAQDSTSITITSTQNQINNTIAANGLRYTSDLNFNSGFGTETLHIVTSDNGNTGTPGALGDTDDLTVTVLAVNDNPNLQPDTTSAVGYIENAASTALFSLENVDTPLADVDLPANYLSGSIDLNITAGLVTGDRINLTGARFIIVGGAVQDTANGNAVVGTIGATNGTSHLTISALTAAATPGVVDALLKSFGYDSASDNPGAGDRTITLTFNDGGNTGSGGAKTDAVTQTVNVTPVNDAPVSTITPTTYSATEQVNLVLKNNGLAVSDVDGNSGVETITLSVTEGTLTVTVGDSGVTVDSGNGTGSVVVSGTLAQLNALLGAGGTSNLVYIDNTDTPGASATLTLLIHDNGNSGTPPPGDLSAQDTATINITAVNDVPVAALGTDPYAATENVALDIKNTGMSVSDVDAGGAVVAATLSVTEGILNVTAGSSGVTNVTGNGTNSVTITGTLAQINALLNTDGTSTVSYTETNDNPSATVTLTLQLNDQGNTGTGGAQTGSDTSTINITAANDAPIATITPTTYSATEQVALSLKNNGLAVSDIDGNAGSQTVTLSVTEGILNVTAGGSGAIVSNSGTSSVTITGTIAQINALLNTDGTSTVSYIDNTDTPSASTSLTLLIHDNGNTGGGDLTSQDNATINIGAVNDAPSALMATDPYAATENVALNIKNTGMSVSDVDAGSAVVTATLSVTQGILNVTAGSSGVTNVTGDGTGSVTVTGTLAAINALLNTDGTSTVSYTETNDNPSATVTLTLQIDDGGNTGTGGAQTGNDTSAINITAVNDAPVSTITPTAYVGTQGVSVNLKNSGLAVSDVDGNAGSETVTLSVTSGTLTVTAGGSGAIVLNSGTASVTITGTIAQINALLNTDGTSTVSFLDAVGGSKTLTLLIHDNGNTGGGDLSGQDTAAINLGEPPVLVDSNPAAGDNPTFTENGAVVTAIANPASPSILISDADAPGAGDQINKATIKITGGLTAGDVLAADTTGFGSITASFDGVDTLTLTGPGTIADFSAVLHTVTFQNTGEDPTNGGANATRTLSWTVFDVLDIPSNIDTTSINVTAINDGPAAVITPASFIATEQVALNLKSAGLSVSDVDANTNSVTVTLSVTEGTLTVTAGGSGAGVAGSGTSSVTLTGTIAQINALLTTDATSTVSYTDGTDNPSASATLTLTINDNGNTGGGALPAQDTAAILITAVNDGPAAAITPPTYNATENVALSLKNNGLAVSDVDANAGSMTVTLSVTEGILNVTAGGSGALVTNSGTGSVTVTGTVAQINALLNTDGTSTVQYVENDDTPSATATLTLAIHDNGNTGGGDLSAQDTATINITAVNDLPVIGNLTPSLTYVVASPPQTLSPGATVTDPDSAGNLVSASVTLTNHQTGDELSVSGVLNGGPVNGISWTYTAATGVLAFTGSSSLANYQALLDQVQYRSTSGDPSNGGATLLRDVAWIVNDGTDPSVTQHTVISLGNQAPAVDLNGGGGGTNADQPFFEGGGAVGVASALSTIADLDDANLVSATIVLTNAKPGDTLSINGALPSGITSAIDTTVDGQITVTLSGSASKANYATAIQQVVFNNGSDNPDLTDRQITVTVNDGEDNSNSAITTVHIAGVNDGPTNGVPGTQNIEANTSTAIGGLSVADPDSAGASITTTLSVAHGTLTVASAGGAAVGGSGTGTVTLTGSVAAINTTLSAANNVVYAGAHDFFGTDTLTVLSNDLGNTGTGGALTDTDNVTLNVNTLITGTTGNDSFNALPGQERIDAGLGIDTITFGFRLVDASVAYEGNKVIIDGPSGSHTVLTGFEVFTFTDGTVNNNDGSPLIDDLFYYSKYHDVWNAHIDADAHYNSVGWHEGRDPDAFFSTVVYLSANPDVKAAGVNPLTHFDTSGWKEGRVPSINFDPAQYLAANPDVAAANVDPLRHFLADGYQEGRQPFAPTELVAANGFDYVYYLQHNPDVAAAGVDPFQHFQTVGWQEGRNPNALFDTNGYLANYADVAAAHVNPLDHYNQFGWHEGRDPSVGFDTTSYLAAYADVNAANVNPLTHFLHFGIHEGRSPFADGVWG